MAVNTNAIGMSIIKKKLSTAVSNNETTYFKSIHVVRNHFSNFFVFIIVIYIYKRLVRDHLNHVCLTIT